MISFGVDIGGSGIKGAPVDVSTAALVEKRYRVRTPQPATPDAVIRTVQTVVEHHKWTGPLGVAVPGVVVGGVVHSATNITSEWVGFDARTEMTDRLGMPVSIINDADAAGIAEIRFGRHDADHGVALVLTFGTGIGSALFNNGILVPNTEFGILEFKSGVAEEYAAGRLVGDNGLDIDTWAGRVAEYLAYVETIVTPQILIIGGGISGRFSEFEHLLGTRTRIRPARMRNDAGIVGAAMIAGTEEQT